MLPAAAELACCLRRLSSASHCLFLPPCAGNPELSEITSAVVAAAATVARNSAIHNSTQLPPPVPQHAPQHTPQHTPQHAPQHAPAAAPQHAPAAAPAPAPAGSAPQPAPGDASILSDDCEHDELEMLQQQVDLLARHSSVSMHIAGLPGNGSGITCESALAIASAPLPDVRPVRASAEASLGHGGDSDDLRETAAMATIIASGVLPAAANVDGGSVLGEDELEAHGVVMMAGGDDEESEEGAQ